MLRPSDFPTVLIEARPEQVHILREPFVSDASSDESEREGDTTPAEAKTGDSKSALGAEGKSASEDTGKQGEGKEGGGKENEGKDGKSADGDNAADDDESAAAAAAAAAAVAAEAAAAEAAAVEAAAKEASAAAAAAEAAAAAAAAQDELVEEALKTFTLDLSEQLFMGQLSKWTYNHLVNREENGEELEAAEDAELTWLERSILGDEADILAASTSVMDQLLDKSARRMNHLLDKGLHLLDRGAGPGKRAVARRKKKRGLRSKDRHLLRKVEAVVDEAEHKKAVRAHEADLEERREVIAEMKIRQARAIRDYC